MTPASRAPQAVARRGSFARAGEAFRASVEVWRVEYALACHASAMAALPRRHLGATRALYVPALGCDVATRA